MMELNIDLLKKEKNSKARIAVGVFFVILAILFLADQLTDQQPMRPMSWMLFALVVLNGILHTAEGFGFSLASLYTKAFVHINPEKISAKPSAFRKEQNVAWSDVKSIVYKPGKFHIETHNADKILFDFSKLEYAKLLDIKETISSIAKEKGLNIF